MMTKLKYFIFCLIFTIFCISSSIAIGDTENENAEIKLLSTEIQNRKSELDKIKERQEIYTQAIKEKQTEQANLINQLAILQNRLAKAELDIDAVNIEIDQTTLEIKKVILEINEKNEQIETEKRHITNILKLLYKQEQADTLEIILLNDSLVDFLNQLKYLEDVNGAVKDSMDTLKTLKKQLEKDKITLDEKNKELETLKKDLEQKKLALESEKSSKEFLLEQVKDSEGEYQSLLSRAKQEQSEAASDIATLEKSVREKLANIKDNKLEFNDDGLIWPVPKNVVTSTFHDPDYPFRYIFEHPAIDIRAAQGTTLKAAASGYVARVKIEGREYGYIMIVHGDGLSTVYGHASKSYVSEEEYVVQGQIIGLSGGMPGTTGAGRLTTGAHLHFEVRLNGIPVNPMEYLP